MNIENTRELQEYLEKRGIISNRTEFKSQLLTGGVSNRTVKIDFQGDSWVIKQALPKLRVQGDWFSAPERIYYEAEAIRWFDQHLPGICPKLTFEDKVRFIMAMEAVPAPFDNLKELFMNEVPNPDHFFKAGKLLGQIHSLGVNQEKMPDLFFDSRFFESLRIEPYYLECQAQVPQTESFFRQLIEDTRNNHYTFTHGDYSPKNLLVKNQRLILLDHEVAHFGDGTFDLGFFIAHLLSKVNHHGIHRTVFLQGVNDFFGSYKESQAPMDPVQEQRAVRHSIGCLLARVKGLSRLEYLNPSQQQTQLSIGLRLISKLPPTIADLVASFREHLPAEIDKN